MLDLPVRETQWPHPCREVGLVPLQAPPLLRCGAVIPQPVRLNHDSQLWPEEVDFVAVYAGYLLGDIRLDRDVATPGGDDSDGRFLAAGFNLEGHRLFRYDDSLVGACTLRPDPDAREQIDLDGPVERRPEQAIDTSRPERDAPGAGFGRGGIDPTAGDGPAGPFGDETGGSVSAESGQPPRGLRSVPGTCGTDCRISRNRTKHVKLTARSKRIAATRHSFARNNNFKNTETEFRTVKGFRVQTLVCLLP